MRALIVKLERWTQLNAYEGQVELLVDGQRLYAHLLLSSEDAWTRWRPGQQQSIRLWLERDGNATRAPDVQTPRLLHRTGCHYELTGQVLEQRPDQELLIQGPFPIVVDLDWPDLATFDAPAIHAGDSIRVQGMLKAELLEEA